MPGIIVHIERRYTLHEPRACILHSTFETVSYQYFPLHLTWTLASPMCVGLLTCSIARQLIEKSYSKDPDLAFTETETHTHTHINCSRKAVRLSQFQAFNIWFSGRMWSWTARNLCISWGETMVHWLCFRSLTLKYIIMCLSWLL